MVSSGWIDRMTLEDPVTPAMPGLGPREPQRIRQQVRDAFYTDTDTWKQQVLAQGVENQSPVLAPHEVAVGLLPHDPPISHAQHSFCVALFCFAYFAC